MANAPNPKSQAMPRTATPRRLSPPLKWHGGKHYLARHIVSLMPRSSTVYCEPFAGGLAVLLARDPSGSAEIVNDLDQHLTTFWRVLQDDEAGRELIRRLDFTPFNELEWDRACDLLGRHDRGETLDPVTRAWAFFVQVRQSLAGRRDTFAPLSTKRVRRGMGEQASAWLTSKSGLDQVRHRLARVQVVCRDAVDVIRQHDGPETLFYCDPPYLGTTRAVPCVYAHEMGQADHERLLATLAAVRGKVILSGYPSRLYDAALVGWRRVELQQPNHAAGGKSKREMTECLWLNWPDATVTGVSAGLSGTAG